jgi:hypothetical protein
MLRAVGFLLIVLTIVDLGWAATPEVEHARIESAIVRVEKSGLIFIRNGSEYPSAQGAKHLRDKLMLAGSSVKTFDEFVEKIASKSSITGRPYMVKFPDGRTEEVAKWLREPPATQP